MNLEGKRVLITGAGSGIGRALVVALLDEGAQILLSGRDRAALTAVVEHHAERRWTAMFAADITNALDRARLCDYASRWRGGIDILINNAAVNDPTLLTTQSAESLDAVVATNLLAPIDLCRRLSSGLGRGKEAHIVNIGSVLGSIGFARNSVDCATKFGLRGFSEALRRELADTNTRVHYFAPRVSDDPTAMAYHIVRALQAGKLEHVIGWPESFLARLNALLPRLVDMALAQKVPATLPPRRLHSRSGASSPDGRPSGPASYP